MKDMMMSEAEVQQTMRAVLGINALGREIMGLHPHHEPMGYLKRELLADLRAIDKKHDDDLDAE